MKPTFLRALSRLISALGLALIAAGGTPPVSAAAPADKARDTIALRGRVVWLAEALQRLHGVQLDDDAAQTVAALETAVGELYPLAKDARGRGFWLDERLQKLDLELLVRRLPGSPVVQVIRVYSLHDEQKFELDYWCDICAIPMFELKACECCQGETRLRERRVEDGVKR